MCRQEYAPMDMFDSWAYPIGLALVTLVVVLL
jgi:hypothetical protein